MLHPELVAELLDSEMTVAQERLGNRICRLWREGALVKCEINDTNIGTAVLQLDGSRYDAEPFGFSVVDGQGNIASAWPGNLVHSVHPVLGRPWACVQGTYEYHAWPGHHEDAWDVLRSHLRMGELLDHLIKRAHA